MTLELIHCLLNGILIFNKVTFLALNKSIQDDRNIRGDPPSVVFQNTSYIECWHCHAKLTQRLCPSPVGMALSQGWHLLKKNKNARTIFTLCDNLCSYLIYPLNFDLSF